LLPSGPHLTRQSGVFNGPSGKETYYNLNMSGVVRILQRSGIDGYFWVRSDGVKMWGDYVMCAADLSIRPRGSLVNTSLGKGIVVDTGTFIYSNRAQLDIAVTW
jgi:3D (Asp-Asp-Asp) domain-containing protein